MRTAAIVQARVGSSRLPGKVLSELGGKSVLAHVLDRCRRIRSVDIVICAVPDSAASAPVEEIAQRCGATVYRGSERDVLDRYLGAARRADADVVLRVTSDCPLIDPEICDRVIRLRMQSKADYASNNLERSFPHGLDCEAFTADALAQAAERARLPEEREHVTPWLRRAEHLQRVNLPSGDPALAEHRWTLDYPEDLLFFRALFDRMPAAARADMQEIVAFLGRNPDIPALNAMRRSA